MKRFFSDWKVLVYVVLTLYAVITLIPFLWALSGSFKPLSEIVSGASSKAKEHNRNSLT